MDPQQYYAFASWNEQLLVFTALAAGVYLVLAMVRMVPRDQV